MAAPRAAELPPASPLSRGDDSTDALRFLQGGGEMGARMRALDWTRTPLGPASAWPQSLKTIVRVMLDSRYAMWMLWGPQMTFFCNDAYAPTLGIKRDWALGARSDKVWTEIWPDVGPRIERVLTQGEATWDEGLLLFLERSGFLEETYHTFSYSPVYDDGNRVAGMLCVVTEVTEGVIGERRLRVLRDLAARAVGVDSVVESCRGACDVLSQYPHDVPFAAIYLTQGESRRAARVACSGAAAARALPEVLDFDDAGTWPIGQLHATESPQHMAQLPAGGLAIAAGSWHDLVRDALLLPLKGSGAGLAGFIIAGCSPRHALDQDYRSFLELVAGQVASAIADAQAYEAERRRAEALAELDRAKTAFFSNVSHEFRTPLTLMLGPLEEALASEGVVPPIRDRIELAQRNATRLQRLVNALLDFSRIEAGRARATFEPTDLPALTRDLASTFRSAMDKAGLEFVVDAPPAMEPVYVDREMWEKIVLNLLSNAFKFTLEGSVRVTLRVGDGAAQLEVTDTGAGIPAHEMPRLFERFHRVEGAQGRTHEGSGIGLALVLELVRLHGGTIDATSTAGDRTTFRVRLPLGSAHLPADHVRRQQVPAPGTGIARSFVEEALRWLPDAARDSGADALVAADSMPNGDRRFAATFGARIVLADDNADMRAYVRELLAPYYRVEAVADGAAALAAAHRALPDLILSDVMMPRLDGFQLLSAVRADTALASVAVVLLSARTGEEARIEGLDSGADDYLVKPFSARELLARIGSLLELRRIRAQAESALRQRTAQFEALLDAAPLGVFLVDADFRVREANPTARNAFDAIPEPVGTDFDALARRLWLPEHAEEIVRTFRHTLATGEAYFVPERIEQRRDRDVAEYYEWQVSRIPLPDGRFGVVCYFRDISAHVHARLQLEQADRQKDEFLAMLAHELRNPLAPIRNAGEILSRLSARDPRAQAAVGIVQRQILALTRLVDDLLDVSRITQGRIELQLRIIQLSDVIAQAVEIVDPLLQERRHELSTSSHGQLRVHGDLARLVQCVANVLTNAAKYTDRGGRIQLEVRDDGGEAVISVTDNGIGIPPELQPKVFDLFVQGDRALDRAQGGLGIGLSVVKRLVDMHGGTVSVTSEGAGRGSRFAIRLPTLAKDVVAEDRPPVPQQAARRVLIVDDNVDAADSLTMILRLDGHEVECAYTARDGLAQAIRFRPDAAFLDIGLPGMNGYELASRMREDPQLAGAYLVALTGYGQADDKVRARDSGFDAHLVKPADLRALQEILASIRRSPPR